MKLTQAIDRLTTDLGEPYGTVRLKARLMREAGMISSGGRGKGGADMTALDFSALFLAMLSIGEPTNVVATVRDMGGAPFSGCEWQDWKALEGSWPRREGQSPRRYLHRGGLPPRFEGLPSPCPALDAMARLISLAAVKDSTIAIEHVEFRSDQHGLTIELKHSDLLRLDLVRETFIARTGDHSDGMMFPECDDPKPTRWDFTAEFMISADQRSRKIQMQRIPGEIIARIAREALAS